MEDLEEKLDAFVKRALNVCSAQCTTADEQALLLTYANEAKAGLHLIAPAISRSRRILEIGSGIGLLSTFLAHEGFNVTGIEPGASGFGFMHQLARTIANHVENGNLTVHPIGAAELSSERHGTYDLIFSLNVIEHIMDLASAFEAMSNVLSVGGTMIHQCPNYIIPYEPHFGIPLIPMAPRATKFIFPRVRTKYPGVWDSLNFITASKVRRIAKQNGLSLTFDRKVMGNAIRRLQADPVYRERQDNPTVRLAAIIAKLGGLRVIDAIPPGLATPMVIRFERSI
jgi:2-polyprenyl-3-methyl-5-hydroxy-6-metoxy-1,4-benzoquinol methylase